MLDVSFCVILVETIMLSSLSPLFFRLSSVLLIVVWDYKYSDILCFWHNDKVSLQEWGVENTQSGMIVMIMSDAKVVRIYEGHNFLPFQPVCVCLQQCVIVELSVK